MGTEVICVALYLFCNCSALFYLRGFGLFFCVCQTTVEKYVQQLKFEIAFDSMMSEGVECCFSDSTEAKPLLRISFPK